MTRKFLTLIFLGLSAQLSLGQKTVYTTTGGEWIFSSADIKMNSGVNAEAIIRFSPFFNLQSQAHRDFNNKAGMFTGFSIRNVGFIYDDPAQPGTRYKARNYTLGLPIALKFGKMDGIYYFVGYEIEFPINYKEKKFVNDDKVAKDDYWFSARCPSFYNTWFAGIQLPEGVQLKFKYYMTNFFNRDFTTLDASGNTIRPYDFQANVFYVSMSFQILKGSSFVYKHKE